MKRLLTITSLLFIISGSVSSCNKVERTPNFQQDGFVKAIGARSWKLVNITVSPAINGSTNYFQTEVPSCEHDNIYNFNDYGFYTNSSIDEGGDRCSQVLNQVIYGMWTFDSGSRQFEHYISVTDGKTYSFNLTITSYSSSSFTGTSGIVIAGTDHMLTWTFSGL